MFGKLLKNDLKAQFYSMSTIFFGVFVITAAAEIVAIFSDNVVGKVFGGLAAVCVLLFACVFIMIAVGLMYSKTMFGRAGYLTLTLPVKTSKLIWSKTVSGLIWTFCVYFLFLGATVLWIYQVKDFVGEDAMESAEMLLTLFGVPTFKMISVICIFFAAALSITVLLIIQSMYLGITLSNVKPFSKFGVIGSLVVFFVTFYVIQEISTGLSDLLPFGMVIKPETITFTSNTVETAAALGSMAITMRFCGPVIRLVMGILLHFPIVYFTKNKVNVQ